VVVKGSAANCARGVAGPPLFIRSASRACAAKIVKEHDDLLCASRYAMMMKRHASTAKARREFYRKIEYPNIGIV
jgi:hypothetical protein